MDFLKKFIGIILLSLISCKSGLAYSHISVGTSGFWNSFKQPLLITSNEKGQWKFNSLGIYTNHGISLYDTKSTNKTNIIVGSAETYKDAVFSRSPIFVTSNDKGNTWSIVKSIANLPQITDSVANKMICSKHICTAVGWYSKNNNANSFPLMLTSNDDGLSWFYQQNIAHLPPKNGSLETVNCFDNLCLAAGSTYDSEHQVPDEPFILISYNYGETWEYKQNISGIPKKDDIWFKFSGIQCNKDTCVAIGKYTFEDKFDSLLLLVSKDKGLSWKFVEFPELSKLKSFLFIEKLIVANGNFIAVGSYGNRGKSLILISKDDAQSWSIIKNISDASPNPGWLKSISCSNTTCIAGGTSDFNAITLLVSKDSGQNWKQISNVDGITYLPDIQQVECTDDLCTALAVYGDNFDYYHPIFLVSYDQGNSWISNSDIQKFPSDLKNIEFSSMCTL